MPKRKPVYTREFKLAILGQVNSGVPVVQVLLSAIFYVRNSEFPRLMRMRMMPHLRPSIEST